MAYPRGELGRNGGSGLPTFQNVGPRDSHKNVIKLIEGGGGRADRVELVPEILEKQTGNGFIKYW